MDADLAPGAELDRLALRARDGDRAAYDELVLAVHSELCVFIGLRTRDAALAEEILQQTLIEAYRALPSYRPGGRLVAWLKGIARNRLARAFRQRQRSREQPIDALDAIFDDAEEASLHELDDELGERLRHCLDRLTPRVRQILLRRHVTGETLSLLARAFKQPKERLVRLLYRVRGQLRQCIQTEGPHGY